LRIEPVRVQRRVRSPDGGAGLKLPQVAALAEKPKTAEFALAGN